MVEQEAVNFKVPGSNPGGGAIKSFKSILLVELFLVSATDLNFEHAYARMVRRFSNEVRKRCAP